MTNKYKKGNLKEYGYWVLAVSFRQHTLGSMVIMAKRDVERLSQLTDDEILELKLVMQQLESILQKATDFKPDRFNYLQLGNSSHQLHIHVIPRYSSSRHFVGKDWIDKNYGHRPIFLTKEEESDTQTVVEIKDYLKQFFN